MLMFFNPFSGYAVEIEMTGVTRIVISGRSLAGDVPNIVIPRGEIEVDLTEKQEKRR